MINKKFGKWTVLKLTNKDIKSRQKYLCVCECGTQRKIRYHSLISGQSKSCGCYKFKTGSSAKTWKGCGEISGYFWCKLLDSSKSKKRDFNITLEYIWKLFLKQNKRCALTNEPLVFGSKYQKISTTASLDRINSSKGYVKGNVQWVHKDINKMKTDFNEQRFIKLCMKVAINYKGEK